MQDLATKVEGGLSTKGKRKDGKLNSTGKLASEAHKDSEKDIISINMSDVEPCNAMECMKKVPHVHTLVRYFQARACQLISLFFWCRGTVLPMSSVKLHSSRKSATPTRTRCYPAL